MPGIHSQIPGKGTTQRAIGGDQGAQAFIDLAVHALPALLDHDHDQQPDTNANQGNQAQPDHCGQKAVP
ncbi:hypothetical protein AA11826_0928 [Komagataeibacter oboediens DSM 11826]|nr:hypothetical protein AA11826_0928 [Komagataeibacter oboediens DSM 11826]